jgi:Rrf2 family protein
MQILASRGILRSEQGAHGGYQLTKDLTRVSLYEIVEMIMGPIGVAKCLHDDKDSPCEIRETCNIVSPVQALNRKLGEFYRSVTVAELLEGRPSPITNGRASVGGLAGLAAQNARVMEQE